MEIEAMKSQIVTSSNFNFYSGQEGGRRKPAYAFTDQRIKKRSAEFTWNLLNFGCKPALHMVQYKRPVFFMPADKTPGGQIREGGYFMSCPAHGQFSVGCVFYTKNAPNPLQTS